MNRNAMLNRIEIEQGSTNVYADLGMSDSDDLLVKAGLAREIGEVLRVRGITQQRAAKLIGIPQSKLSALLSGQFRGVSQAKLIECLNRLGFDIDIVVRATLSRGIGHTHVVVA